MKGEEKDEGRDVVVGLPWPCLECGELIEDGDLFWYHPMVGLGLMCQECYDALTDDELGDGLG